MSSTTETGHARNVATFQRMIEVCAGYDVRYRPTKADLSLPNLSLLLNHSRASLSNLNTAEKAYKDAANARADVFEPLRQLCTQVFNALQASDVSARSVANARSINNKLQNRRASAKPTPEATQVDGKDTPIKTISTSQSSYDQMAEHFDKLVVLVSNEASYNPNETELQATTLRTLHTSLIAANDAVAKAITQLGNVRLTRDKLLYAPETGMVDVAKDVKSYVKSVFKANSPEYKQIHGLSLTKQRNSFSV